MAPPDKDKAEQPRGMMAPDPAASATPVSLRAFFWTVAGVVAGVELALEVLS
jgi:hypothetical protein